MARSWLRRCWAQPAVISTIIAKVLMMSTLEESVRIGIRHSLSKSGLNHCFHRQKVSASDYTTTSAGVKTFNRQKMHEIQYMLMC
jgi:hypothetical protein